MILMQLFINTLFMPATCYTLLNFTKDDTGAIYIQTNQHQSIILD